MEISSTTTTTTSTVRRFNFVGQNDAEAAELRDLHALLSLPNRIIRSEVNGAPGAQPHLLGLEVETVS